MALITCPDCGKQVSSRAAACPNCGCPLNENIAPPPKQETVSAESTPPLSFEMYDKKNQLLSIHNGKVSLSNNGYVYRECTVEEFSVLKIYDPGWFGSGEFLVRFGGSTVETLTYCDSNDLEKVKEMADNLKAGAFQPTSLPHREQTNYVPPTDDYSISCPRCGGKDIVISLEEVGSKTKGKAEVRKKSPVTNAANSVGRATMIVATGGLWALTPKKSKYKETKTSTTKTKRKRFGVCQNCGFSWKLGFFD